MVSSVFRVMEEHAIMSFSVDKSDRFALINLSHQGIHLWDIRDKTLLMKFRGMSQGYFTINSCFGGVDEKFVASGSEGKLFLLHEVLHVEPPTFLCTHSYTHKGVH